jgi:hypothetical protein
LRRCALYLQSSMSCPIRLILNRPFQGGIRGKSRPTAEAVGHSVDTPRPGLRIPCKIDCLIASSASVSVSGQPCLIPPQGKKNLK